MTTPDPVLASKIARAELAKRVLIVVTVVLVTVVLALVLVLLAQVRQTQRTGTPLGQAILSQQKDIKRGADAATETNEQILDCLNPDGACYKRSQNRSAQAISSINEISQYAAVCADRPGSQSLDEIRRCIADLITAAAPVDRP